MTMMFVNIMWCVVSHMTFATHIQRPIATLCIPTNDDRNRRKGGGVEEELP